MDIILKYFPNLSEEQKRQFAMLYDSYMDWNAKINVISRKDIEHLYERHVLHSLAIAKLINFRDGTHIMDVGTGGGFPGLPLAIMFPKCDFFLIDSIGKKIRVATEIANNIGLQNMQAKHSRVQDIKEKFDFVISRAVMPLPELVALVRKNISSKQHNILPNGLICLKGGDLQEEMRPFKKISEADDLSIYFDEPFFETKKIVYVTL